MWFRNLQLYRLPAPWNQGPEQLLEKLSRHPFQRYSSQDPVSAGWLSPRGSRSEDASLLVSVGGHWLVALGVEQKLLPASVINEVAQDKAEEIAAQQGFPPGRKQMKEIKEDVVRELLPRAFSRRRRTALWIDPRGGWLAVDASSPSKAEEVLEVLRESLDELPLKLVKTQRSPAQAMADWLAGGEAPGGFTLDKDCELKSVLEDKAAVRYVRHPLEGDGVEEEIRGHLAAGKQPTRLAMTWNDRVSFILTEKLEVKRIGFLDVVQEEAEKLAEAGSNHVDELFDANFALMTGELSRLIPDLIEALGGEMTEDSLAGLTQAAPTPAPSSSAQTTTAAATEAPPWDE